MTTRREDKPSGDSEKLLRAVFPEFYALVGTVKIRPIGDTKRKFKCLRTGCNNKVERRKGNYICHNCKSLLNGAPANVDFMIS